MQPGGQGGATFSSFSLTLKVSGMAAKAKAALGHQSPTSPQSLRRPPSALLSKVIYPLNINEQLQKGRLLLLRRTESASKQTSERLNE